MKIKPKRFQVGGKTTINEKSAYRYHENMYSPIEYHPFFPKKEVMQDLMDFIKNTSMSSTNEIFPLPKVESAINTSVKALDDEKAKHHEIIMHIVRDDGHKKRKLALMIKEADEYLEKVTIR